VISLVVAVADNGVIGVNNQLPWRLPNDLQRFKSITMGKAIIMGRKTFESIGKPLPGRRNIVVSRRPDLVIDGCTVVNSVQSAIEAAGKEDELMVIGGADIYRQALPLAQRIYLTRVHADIQGDADFPQLDTEWREVSCEQCAADERHAYPYSFVVLERVAL
jgi:dihydrofolate reductase